jgi:hypothetical protein
MQIGTERISVTGKLVKVARLEDEWFTDIGDPELYIDDLKKEVLDADIFSFWQRLPDSQPKYNYHTERDPVAAIKITTYENWFKNQISAKTRNLIRKAGKKNVTIKEVNFDDSLVRGIVGIFSETPIRQGKKFVHYGKKFDKIKEEMSDRLDRSRFIGAHYGEELIGFVKLLDAKRYTMMVEILSKIRHRDKSPQNALIAKAVEICAEKRAPYLVYSLWGKGSLHEFKKHNGFEKIEMPRYYVPLNLKGRIALKLGFHRRLSEVLPEIVFEKLTGARSKWYSFRYSNV